MSLKIPARAKINLCLEIDGLRPDGYHALWSIMHSVTLSDTVRMDTVEDSVGLRLTSRTKLPDDNTFVRAYDEFIKAHPEASQKGVHVEFDKHIPWCAGLGGASADAAAELRLLYRMFEVPDDDIMQVGARVGSDVPFCLLGGCAQAQGRGDILTQLKKSAPTTHILLVKCKQGARTQDLFRAYDEQNAGQKKEAPEETAHRRERLLSAVSGDSIDFSVFREQAKNDLEDAVFRVLPEVRDAKRLLYDNGACFALMTGSGSTVFGIFRDTDAMKHAQREAWARGYAFIHRCRLAPDRTAAPGARYGEIVL